MIKALKDATWNVRVKEALMSRLDKACQGTDVPLSILYLWLGTGLPWAKSIFGLHDPYFVWPVGPSGKLIYVHIFKRLLKIGVLSPDTSPVLARPLASAVKAKDVQMVDLLLRHNVPITFRSSFSGQSCHLIARKGSTRTTNSLSNAGIRLRNTARDGDIPLRFVSTNFTSTAQEIAHYLTTKCARIETRILLGLTPLEVQVEFEDFPILKECRAPEHSQDLTRHVYSNMKEKVARITSHELGHQTAEKGLTSTPVLWDDMAEKEQHWFCLISSDARLIFRHEIGHWTLEGTSESEELSGAVFHRKIIKVEGIISENLNVLPYQVNNASAPALPSTISKPLLHMLAAGYRSVDVATESQESTVHILRLLLKTENRFNEMEDLGSSLIHHLVHVSASETFPKGTTFDESDLRYVWQVVGILKDAGADINAIDHDQKTPLWYAYVYDKPWLVRVLLENGARCYSDNDFRQVTSGGQMLSLLHQHDLDSL